MREHHGATVGDCGLDETLESIREEMRKFADSEVVPHAHEWHLTNSYIPLEVIAHMAELGVFGLTIPEEFGGMGLGKESMCVVSEELSRGYIGVGSLGTRSEIAAELILGGGTDEQKRNGCRRSHPAKCCRPPCSPSRTRALTWPRCKHARRARGRRLQGPRQQDLDHAPGPRRPDDAAGAHRPEGAGLSRPLDAARRKAARRRCRSVSRARHVGRRDRGARLSRHEGIRDRVRRLRGDGRQSAWRNRGAGLQATDADLRVRAHPDRGARGRRCAGRDGACARAMPRSACSSARSCLPSRASPTRSP